jgi:hypothetical protein
MDHNMKSSPLTALGDADALSLDDVIASKILDAVITIETCAPVYLLEVGSNFAGSKIAVANDAVQLASLDDEAEQAVSATESLTTQIQWDSKRTGVGSILLPDDFLRLIVFKMSDWDIPVFETIDSTDDEYLVQRSKYGVAGNSERPVCAIVPSSNGNKLEFYSCESNGATIEQAIYRPYPTIDSNGGVDISPKCYRAVIYQIAGLVFSTYGEEEMANKMFELAKTQI